MKVLVIIPAYNEEDNIVKTVNTLFEECPTFDYVIVNDASTDNTEKIIKKQGLEYISLPTNLGIGGAVQTGYQYAVQNNYDIAIQMDGDGQHNPKYYECAVQIIEKEEADIVIGSRFINKEGFQSSPMRRIGIVFLSTLIKIVCGISIKDVTSGYRIVNREYMEYFSKEYAQDYPEPEAIVSACKKGAKIVEIPVMMDEREGGVSSIGAMKSIYYMIKVSIAIVLVGLFGRSL